jgi:hypothetical protein
MGMERFGVCFAVLFLRRFATTAAATTRRQDARRPPPDLLAQDPVGAADVAGALGLDRRGLEAEPVLADGPAASCTMPIASGGPTGK